MLPGGGVDGAEGSPGVPAPCLGAAPDGGGIPSLHLRDKHNNILLISDVYVGFI